MNSVETITGLSTMEVSSRSHRSLSPNTVVPLQWWRSVLLLFSLLVVVQASTGKDNATLSGLVYTNVTNNEELQWNDQEIPPLLGAPRYFHSSVVLENPLFEEDQTIVVLGGLTEAESATDIVILLNVGKGTKEWREGPKMNEKIQSYAVVVCNGWVFAIGGRTGDSWLNTIEYIRVADLLESTRKRWKTLDARLSSSRDELAAAVVRNRYIVVAGRFYYSAGTCPRFGLWTQKQKVDQLSFQGHLLTKQDMALE